MRLANYTIRWKQEHYNKTYFGKNQGEHCFHLCCTLLFNLESTKGLSQPKKENPLRWKTLLSSHLALPSLLPQPLPPFFFFYLTKFFFILLSSNFCTRVQETIMHISNDINPTNTQTIHLILQNNLDNLQMRIENTK